MMGEMSDDSREPATKEDVQALAKATKEDIRALAKATKEDLGVLATKAEFGGLRREFNELRGEFKSFRDEMLGEFKSFRDEIREMIRPIAITVANHTVELADIRGYLRDNMVTRDEFHSRMDAFSGRVYDQDYSTAKNRVRLDEHEKRIAALEAKRA